MNQEIINTFKWLGAHFGPPIRIALIFVLMAVALRLMKRAIPKIQKIIERRHGSNGGAQRIRTLSEVIRYLLTVVITIVAFILVLSEIGISVAPILGAAGVVGIAIGFGAQSLVKDYFTGFFLLLENQIRIGDVVDAGGKNGVVEEVTLRYLRLRDYSGSVHYIPNGTITIVSNMSMGFAYAVMDIGVGYGEDITHVLSVLRQVGEKMRDDPVFASKILNELEIAGVENLAESAVVVRCRFRVAPLEQWNIRREFLQRIKHAFDQEGIEIPFPQRRVIFTPTEESVTITPPRTEK